MKKHLLLTACALLALPFVAMAQKTHQLSSIDRQLDDQTVQMAYDAEGRLVQRLVLGKHYDWETETSYTKVDSILTRTYDGDKITQVCENTDPSWRKRTVTVVDKNSKLVTTYQTSLGSDELKKSEEDLTTYDDQHRVLSQIHSSYYGGEFQWSTSVTFTYEGNNVTKETSNYLGQLERYYYTYSDDGKMLSEEFHQLTKVYTGNEEWTKISRTEYSYDDHGNLSNKTVHNYWRINLDTFKWEPDDFISSTLNITNTYDAAGNLIESINGNRRELHEYYGVSHAIVRQRKYGEEGEWINQDRIIYDIDPENNNCISNLTEYYWNSSDNNWEVRSTIDWGFSNTIETSKVIGAVEEIGVTTIANATVVEQKADMVFKPKMALAFYIEPDNPNSMARGKQDYYWYTPLSVLPAQSDGNVVVVPMFDGTNTVSFENNSVVYLLDNMGVKRYYATLTDATCEYDIFSNKLYINGWKEYTEPAAAPKHATRADGSGIVADGNYTIVFPENVLTVNGTTLGETITVVNVDESIETGIQTVAAPQSTNALYNLQGQKITAPANGQIVIMNGKKVLK